jgi:hypothetical protein
LAHHRQGHSKNPACHGFDGVGAVFAIVFAGLANRLAAASDDGEGCISNARERTCTGADTAAILIKRDVADVMQFILNGPMGAIECKQAFGRNLGCRQAGDQIDRFGAGLAADLARAHEPSDLREAGPIEMRHGFGRHLDTARLDAAVAFFDSFCGPKIRRRTVVDPGRL